MLSIEFAVSKTRKHGSRDSGDTVEMAERPTGGVSVVMVDGQGSGEAAKSLSMLVSSKAVSLLKEGIRDGAVARGTHDYLHAFRRGKVSAALDCLSVDLASSTVVVTRNSTVPFVVGHDGEYCSYSKVAGPIGLYRHTRPVIDQFSAEAGLRIILYSDGIASAGSRHGTPYDPLAYLVEHARASSQAQDIADGMLMAAIHADQGCPRDDMTVVVLCLVPTDGTPEPIRRMGLSLPFPG